ncbi:MAG: glycosyltransferase family 4 protein [Candidatus Komeilibacteria bacterium]|nr:glycosyltransferase family 4 protein [Candidatus Komeilibacteria bacterium]
MKLLLITMEWPPFKGGVGNYYFNLVQNLSGHQVSVLEVGSTSFYKYFWPKWLKLFFQIRKLVKKDRPDLIWVGQVLPIGTVALLIKKFFKIPYFVSTHGLDIMLPQKSLRKEKIMRRVLNESKFITSNSKFTKKQLLNLEIPEEKIEVIYPCPNIKAVTSSLEQIRELKRELGLEDKKVLLTVGRLVNRKGQQKVIQAMPALVKKFPEMVYLVIGDGPEGEKLKAQSLKLGLKNKVIFLANISDEELPAYYQLADLFVMPAENLAGDVEGFGIVYLEAAMFGLPSVAGKSGGVMEAVIDGQTGLLVDPNNQDDLAEKISFLLSDKELRQQFSVNGRIRVERDFIWNKQAAKLNKRIYAQ